MIILLWVALGLTLGLPAIVLVYGLAVTRHIPWDAERISE